ncbi:lytic transglycosylase domain-containing protein [Candidatus Cyanaurora vandensis]|uniref:lytic transglycosylase domain-containing protein n=1 Tax=Candidatus Cyanaurora vandensis TaxID=2714958 RepID=UPI00257F8356|nr:lytic transglycosylase domain-containing protein [Candidatus Cyanaurora vandensis]
MRVQSWSLGLVGAIVLGSAVWANSGRVPAPSLPRSERVRQLQNSIPQARTSAEQAALRYVLASTLQDLGDSQGALGVLTGLEGQYSVLKERILVKQAQLLANSPAASAKWQEVSRQGGVLQPEALYQLGLKGDQEAWQQLSRRFPGHPRTALVLSAWLDRAPNQGLYLRQWLTYFADQPASVRYGKQLETLSPTASEWEQLARMYYRHKEYQKTLMALDRAPLSALNLLLMGKSYRAIKQDDRARATWDRLAQGFPDQPEAAQGQLLKATLVPKTQRVNFYQQVALNFPAVGGTALWEATKVASGGTQDGLYQQLVSRFPKSDEAVDAAWELAWGAANRGDLMTARTLGARALTDFPMDKYTTPRLGFWAGRWAEDQGDRKEARAAFQTVLQRFPASYYSWRSAAHLGLVKGEFQVRQLDQPVRIGENPGPLPDGSPVVQELYELGLIQEAQAQYQAETYAALPSPRQQATQAIFQQATGQNLAALRQLLPLAYEDTERMVDLHRFPSFWAAAYPTPHWSQLVLWSNQQNSNPLLALSLMRQESAFEPTIRSRAGALGLMQVMPSTGRQIAGSLGVSQYSLTNPSDNIRFGTWYLAHTHDRWRDNSLLAVASYNAGPGNVNKWTKTLSLADPERFVELIPFRETKGYVKSVFGNYWNYLRLYSPSFQQRLAQVPPVS